MDDPFEELKEKMVLTEEQAATIKDPEWIIPNLIVRGMLHLFPAKYNAGKTTLFTYKFARQIVNEGYQVIYLNADVSASQAKGYRESAAKMGFTLLLPEVTPETTLKQAWVKNAASEKKAGKKMGFYGGA